MGAEGSSRESDASAEGSLPPRAPHCLIPRIGVSGDWLLLCHEEKGGCLCEDCVHPALGSAVQLCWGGGQCPTNKQKGDLPRQAEDGQRTGPERIRLIHTS